MRLVWCLLVPPLCIAAAPPAGDSKSAEGSKAERKSYGYREIRRAKSGGRTRPALEARFLSGTLLTKDVMGVWSEVPSGATLYTGENVALQVELARRRQPKMASPS